MTCTSRMTRTSLRTALLALVLALITNACGDSGSAQTSAPPSETSDGTSATTQSPGGGNETDLGLPAIDPLDASEGDIGIAGSSTVFPLTQAVLSQWIDEGGTPYTVDSIGSGGGFERFCVEGASDITNASRPINDEEIASCNAIGREPIEIRVGTDALSVVISNGNTFATELTLQEIATAFSLPAGSTWADVNPDFPANELQAFSPGADSGTFDYFNEEVFDEADPSPILSAGVVEIVGEDDNLTVRGVADDGCNPDDPSTTCAIGYFGYAFFSNNAGQLQAVSVDGGDGPVAPGDDSVNAGTYPLARPLFMYTDAGIVAEKPQVAEFIAYYLANVNAVIGDVGYFPAPPEDLQAAADAIADAAGF